MFQPRSIRSAIYFILAISLAPAVGLLIISSHSTWKSVRHDVTSSIMIKVDLLVLRLESVLKNGHNILLVASKLENPASEVLAEILPTDRFYENIYVSDREGNVLAAARNFKPRVNISDYLSKVSSKKEFFLPDPFTKRTVLGMAIPILDTTEALSGMVFLSINLGLVDPYTFQERPYLKVFALDTEGQAMLLHPDDAANGEDREMSLRELRQQEKSRGFFTSTEADGQRVLNAYQQIFSPSGLECLKVCISEPTDQTYAETGEIILQDLIFVFASIMTTLLATSFLSHFNFFRPALSLLRQPPTTRQKEHFLENITQDFANLVRSFDAMALALEERNHELVRASNEVLAVNRAKSEFLTNMSHGICTPMNAIIGLAYLMLKTDLSSKQRVYLNKIYEASNNLLGIINDILDLSRLESDQIFLENNPFQMKKLLEDITDKFCARSSEKKIQLSYHLDPELPAVLLGDAARLGQVLFNLVSNAVKFTEQGDVQISCVQDQDPGEALPGTVRLRLTVQDNGIGMNEEQLGRVFQAFTQMDGSSTRKFGGAGVGLALCRELVHLMRGNINIESALGQGTKVTLSLTLKIPAKDYLQLGRLALDFVGFPILMLSGAASEPDHTNTGALLEGQCRSLGLRVDRVQTPQEVVILLLQHDRGDRYRLVWLENFQDNAETASLIRKIRQDIGLCWVPPLLLSVPPGHYKRGYRGDPADMPDKKLVSPVVKEKLVHELHELFQRLPAPKQQSGAETWNLQHIGVVSEVQRSKPDDTGMERTQMTQQPQTQDQLALPPGFNPDALKRLGNNRKLYRKLLVQFVEFYQDMGLTYQKAVDAGDVTEATRIAHTLKGLAGSIGVDDLAEKAKNLEFAHKDGGISYPELSKTCFDRLREIQALISHALGLGTAPETADTMQISPEAKAEAPAVLEALVTLLKDDDGSAAAFFETNLQILSAVLDQVTIAKLKDSLAHFEFDTALAMLGKK